MGKLDGKVALITGASSGIGKQVAIRFCEEGAKVAVCARRVNKLAETEKECRAVGGEVFSMQCDLTDKASVESFFAATIEKFGKVDILVNNAINDPNVFGVPFIDTKIEDMQNMMELGFYAPWRLMQLCYPSMKANGYGSVINVGSAASVTGMPGRCTYAAVKEAIRGLSKVVAHEWGADNIRVNIILPSALTDSMLEAVSAYPKEAVDNLVRMYNEGNPMKRAGESYRDIAPVCVFLASEDSGFVNGQSIAVDGGYLYSC